MDWILFVMFLQVYVMLLQADFNTSVEIAQLLGSPIFPFQPLCLESYDAKLSISASLQCMQSMKVKNWIRYSKSPRELLCITEENWKTRRERYSVKTFRWNSQDPSNVCRMKCRLLRDKPSRCWFFCDRKWPKMFKYFFRTLVGICKIPKKVALRHFFLGLDRTFDNFRAAKSRYRRTLCCLETPIDRFQGFRIILPVVINKETILERADF